MSKALPICNDTRVNSCFASCRDIEGKFRCKCLTSTYKNDKCPFYKDRKGVKRHEVITN